MWTELFLLALLCAAALAPRIASPCELSGGLAWCEREKAKPQ